MTSSKQRAIADEFGLPFWEVVKGFADDGLSVKATADVLEYSHTAFRRLVERHDKKHWFKVGHNSLVPQQERAERRGKCSPALREALRLASAANPNYIRIEYRGVTDTLAGHSRRLGLSRRTVYKRNKRRPGDWAYVFAGGKHIVLPSRKSGWHQNTFRFGKNRGDAHGKL